MKKCELYTSCDLDNCWRGCAGLCWAGSVCAMFSTTQMRLYSLHTAGLCWPGYRDRLGMMPLFSRLCRRSCGCLRCWAGLCWGWWWWRDGDCCRLMFSMQSCGCGPAPARLKPPQQEDAVSKMSMNWAGQGRAMELMAWSVSHIPSTSRETVQQRTAAWHTHNITYTMRCELMWIEKQNRKLMDSKLY